MKSITIFSLLFLAALSFGCKDKKDDGADASSSMEVVSPEDMPESIRVNDVTVGENSVIMNVDAGYEDPVVVTVDTIDTGDDSAVVAVSLAEEEPVLLTADSIKNLISQSRVVLNRDDSNALRNFLDRHDIADKDLARLLTSSDTIDIRRNAEVIEDSSVETATEVEEPYITDVAESVSIPIEGVREALDLMDRDVMFSAINRCDVDYIDQVLEADALKTHDVSDRSNYTPLVKAILNSEHNKSCMEVVRKLIAYGVDVNEQNGIGNTALHYAVSRNNPVITKELLEHPDINPNLHNLSGYTPLIWAVYRNINSAAGIEPMTLLLDSDKVDVNAIDEHGRTALILAAMVRQVFTTDVDNHGPDYGRGPEITMLLLKRPDIDINLAIDGLKAVDFARLRDHVKVVEILEEYEKAKKAKTMM